MIDALQVIIAKSRNAAGEATQTIRAIHAGSPIVPQRYLRTMEIAFHDPRANFTDADRELIASYAGGTEKDTSTKDFWIRLRVSEQEKEHVEKMADAEGKTVSDYIRDRIGL